MLLWLEPPIKRCFCLIKGYGGTGSYCAYDLPLRDITGLDGVFEVVDISLP